MPADDPLVAFCRSLPGATEDVKWGADLVFSVGGKMFTAFDLPELETVSLKVDPLVFETLTANEGIRPAPYLARHSWITLESRDALPREAIEELIREAHAIVARKLPKKTRTKLGLEV